MTPNGSTAASQRGSHIPGVSWRSALFYGSLSLLLLLSVTKMLPRLLPGGLASQLGHNSEAYLIALLLGAILQWLRPWAQTTRRPWLVLSAVAAVSIAVGVVLDQHKGSLDSSIASLNEAFLAVGVISLYLILRRPVAYAPVLALGLLIAIVVFNRTDLITVQAESLVAIMLAPVSLDVADPTLVDRDAADRPTARLLWCVVLIVVPVVFALLYRMQLSGLAAEIARYGRRPTEDFLAFLFLHLYFSYLLGRRWRDAGQRMGMDTSRSSATSSARP